MFHQLKVFLYRYFFTSWAGLALEDWLALLARARFRISPRYLPRALFITLCAPLNSLQKLLEILLYGKRLAQTPIPPPLFIVGHWRGGTTYLHQLLRLDPRFVAPTMVEVLFPHSLLTGGPMGFFMNLFLPKDRLVDDVKVGTNEPFEDEFALALVSLRSPYLGWAFPRHRQRLEKTLLLDDPDDLEKWKNAFRDWLQKVTLKHGQPALLKSPPHTARLKHLAELFPGARFIHIHRHPVEVFASTCRLLADGIDGLRLQHVPARDPDHLPIEEEVIARYQLLYARYLEDRESFPKDQLIEVRYEDLRADPIGTLAGIYHQLGLPSFDEVKDSFEVYLSAQAPYQPRTKRTISEKWKEKLRSEWRPIYSALGYDIVD